MVAYSFQAQFRAPIIAGTKRQTLRNDRKRHAREGETLQLYTGMRTRQCRLIGTATCLGVSPVRLDFGNGRVEFLETGNVATTLDELHAFAQIDGFPSWGHLKEFWFTEHGRVTAWEGVRISWGDTLIEAVERDGKMVAAA